MNKKVFLACGAALFFSSSALYASDDSHSIKVAASFSKSFTISKGTAGGKDIDRMLKPNIFGTSIMFAPSSSTDIGLELKYFANVDETNCFLGAASFRYLLGGADSTFTPYAKFSAGLYKPFLTDKGKDGLDPDEINNLEAFVAVSSAGLGLDFKITDSIYLTAGADLAIYGFKIRDHYENPQLTLSVGAGFAF
ncbi:hypothetical protein Cyrtocomes_01192 [Candidatus Cyrtobacter comes]|uniref:Outer membrane protein beta-barrel domain-containing protein n=1 Tax=Candidatus Cyrtobacter comes TaxID=675776 RepID=A0ABU5L9K2_9RICK|nr:hypothetical protein [Candidatus Cyrtobacter comes]MDZ5762797.1 hypothetical protein [Candidatus Cyrtobacter comes]